MKISEVYPEYVFQRLGAGKDVDAVDFNKKQYLDLADKSVSFVQELLTKENIKFYQLEEEVSN